jgi:anti-sigma-K factor RskA
MSVTHSKKPWVNIELYIQSGIIESYALGLATVSEREEFEQLMPHYPELKTALSDFEYQLELFAIENEIPPPPGVRAQIDARIREAPVERPAHDDRHKSRARDAGAAYLNVESSSNHIRVHKAWRTLFIVVFILSKIFLALAIWFYVEYRHARQEVRQTQEQPTGVQGTIK